MKPSLLLLLPATVAARNLQTTVLDTEFNCLANCTVLEEDDKCFELTKDLKRQSGVVWSKMPLEIVGRDFTISARLNFGDRSGENANGVGLGADGIAFVLQNSGPQTVGDAGGGMGVGSILPSLGVEFDTFYNRLNPKDLEVDHVAIFRDGILNATGVLEGPVAVGSDLKDGIFHPVTIDWTFATSTFDVYMDGSASPLISHVVDMGAILGSDFAYLGFTSSTGASTNRHQVCIESIVGKEFVKPMGSISGTVKKDTNNNDVGDDPVPNVLVTLTDSSGAVVATTLSDASGNYVFSDLSDGEYTVSETNPAGFVTVNPDEFTVSVANGADVAVDFIDEQLGQIEGTVKRDTDSDSLGNDPVPNVLVTLTDSSDVVVATTLTDASGAFSFGDLTNGIYTVKETNPSGFTSVNPDEVTVTITDGAKVSVEFVDERPGSITGTVKRDTTNDDLGNDPVPNVLVTLMDSSGAAVATTLTDATGSYIFGDLTNGVYTVKETNPSDFTSVNPDEVTVTVTDGAAVMVEFVDERPGSIAGTVKRDTTNDDLGNDPVPNVLVTLTDSAGTTVGTTLTDASGSYVFGNLRDGVYTVMETNPTGFTSINPDEVVANIANGADVTVEFVDERPGQILGTVKKDTDGDGVGNDSVPGVVVTLTDSSNAAVATTLTDASGNYVFGDLIDGEYTVTETNPSGFTSVNPDMVTVTIADGVDVSVEFVDERPGLIAGTVTKDTNGDGTGNDPVPDVLVTLTNSSDVVVATTLTGVSGSYLFDDLMNGVYTVVETNPSGFSSVNPDEVTVTISDGAAVAVEFVDERPGTIAGTVKKDTVGDGLGDEPFPNVPVTLMDSSGGVVATTLSDASGSYVFGNLRDGVYTVIETNPAGFLSVNPDQVTVSIADGTDVTVEFVDERDLTEPTLSPSVSTAPSVSLAPSISAAPSCKGGTTDNEDDDDEYMGGKGGKGGKGCSGGKAGKITGDDDSAGKASGKAKKSKSTKNKLSGGPDDIEDGTSNDRGDIEVGATAPPAVAPAPIADRGINFNGAGAGGVSSAPMIAGLWLTASVAAVATLFF